MQSESARDLAGLALVGVGVLAILSFTTAEAFYPGYSTTTQTISALGAADAPRASQLVFNGAMILSGVLALVAVSMIRNVYDDRVLVTTLALTGVGVAGVGVFPTQYGSLHVIAAMLAFGGSGVSALLAARTTTGVFGYLSGVLGVLVLVTLALFVVLESSNPLGVGGLERWVAYLGLSWVVAFGAYLLGSGSPP